MTFLFEAAQIDEEQLRSEVETVLPDYLDRPLDGNWIRELNRERGTDFASMLLREWCMRSGANGPFYRDFQRPMDHVESRAEDDLSVLILPTMFYREHPEIGGDGILFSSVAARHGIRTSLVPLPSLGSVDENADILLDHFSRLRSHNVWVISFSKGAADFKRAILKDSDAVLPHLAGWLNVGGTVGGTHLTDSGSLNPLKHMMMKSWIRIRGGSGKLTEEINRSHPFSRATLQLPPSIEVINLVGLPLKCHLRKPLVTTYSHLSQWGPNDGVVLIEDAVSIGGHIVPLWGADHYLRVPGLSAFAHQFFRHLLAKVPV